MLPSEHFYKLGYSRPPIATATNGYIHSAIAYVIGTGKPIVLPDVWLKTNGTLIAVQVNFKGDKKTYYSEYQFDSSDLNSFWKRVEDDRALVRDYFSKAHEDDDVG